MFRGFFQQIGIKSYTRDKIASSPSPPLLVFVPSDRESAITDTAGTLSNTLDSSSSGSHNRSSCIQHKYHGFGLVCTLRLANTLSYKRGRVRARIQSTAVLQTKTTFCCCVLPALTAVVDTHHTTGHPTKQSRSQQQSKTR